MQKTDYILALPVPSLSMAAKDHNRVLRRKPKSKITTTKGSEQYGLSEYSAKPSFCISTKKRGLAEFGPENIQIRAKIRRSTNMDRTVKLHCDVSSEISSEHDHYGDSRPGFKHPRTFHTRPLRPRPHCDGEIIRGPGVVVLNEEISCAPDQLSTPVTSTSSTAINAQMSPKRALRVAMLKSRFATIIYKATHQGGKLDPLKMKQEIQRLQREQLEEKERIENEMKATKVIESKMQRQKEREAARMALEKMKRTIEFNDDLDVEKELELLTRRSSM